jgi:hypothetical protein
MRKIIMVSLSLITWFSAFSQKESTNSLDLSIDNFNMYHDSCVLNIQVVNKSQDTILFYRPRLEDICSSILRIYAISKTHTNKYYYLYPCEATIDLESIYIDQNNSIFLLEEQCFYFKLSFKLEDFSPHLALDSYLLYFELNYSIANLKSKHKNLFKSDIIAKSYCFEYNKRND